MYILNIARAIKKLSVNEIKDSIFKNYYSLIGVSEENSYYSMKSLKRENLLLLANKLKEKILDPRNDKEHYQSFLRKNIRKSLKQSEIIYLSTKNF